MPGKIVNVREEKAELKNNIRRRLSRIEGQIRGLQRMIEKEGCCMDILVQISAIRAAVSKVGVMIYENHLHECLIKTMEGEAKDREQALKDLAEILYKLIK